jgi:hypothetical protein
MEEREQRVKVLEQQLVTQKETLMKEQEQQVKELEQQLEDAAPKDSDALAKVIQGSLFLNSGTDRVLCRRQSIFTLWNNSSRTSTLLSKTKR